MQVNKDTRPSNYESSDDEERGRDNDSQQRERERERERERRKRDEERRATASERVQFMEAHPGIPKQERSARRKREETDEAESDLHSSKKTTNECARSGRCTGRGRAVEAAGITAVPAPVAALAAGRAGGRASSPGSGNGGRTSGDQGRSSIGGDISGRDISSGDIGGDDGFDLEAELGKLVGMDELKARLRHFKQSMDSDRRLRDGGIDSLTQSYHLWLTGNPGTGKTTVARLLHKMFIAARVLQQGAPFVEFKPTDAEGDAMGEARLKTKEYIEKAAHGVLFADEAHTLVMDRQNMYGKQVASELMNCLQTPLAEGGCIVVFAGYPGGMKTLLQSDPGFHRRIPMQHRFALADYTTNELAQIFRKMVENLRGWSLDAEVTDDLVAAAIDRATTLESRSHMNGSIAEELLTSTKEQWFHRHPGGDPVKRVMLSRGDIEAAAEQLVL